MAKQALEGKRLNAFEIDPFSVTVLGVDTDHQEGDHPLCEDLERLKVIDPKFVDNIVEQGVLQPVQVTKEPASGLIIVTIGRRRVLHAREAIKKAKKEGLLPISGVPAMAPRKERGSTLFGLMVSENSGRVDYTPLQEAKKLEQGYKLGYTDKQMAKLLMCDQSKITFLKSLLKLSPDAWKMVEKGKTSAHVAAAVTDLPEETQAEELKKLVEAGASGRDAVKHQKERKKATKNGAAAEQTPKVEFHKPPGKVELRKLLALDELEELLSEEVIATIRFLRAEFDHETVKGYFGDDAVKVAKFLRGDIGADRIAGMTKALRVVRGEEGAS